MIQQEQLKEEVYIESGTDPDKEPVDCHPASLNLSNYNIAAIIPAYNEERFIGSVVIKTRTLSTRFLSWITVDLMELFILLHLGFITP